MSKIERPHPAIFPTIVQGDAGQFWFQVLLKRGYNTKASAHIGVGRRIL